MFFIFFIIQSVHALSSDHVKLESGSVRSLMNYYSVPKDTGTLVDLPRKDVTPYFRVEGAFELNEAHGLRFVIAPLELTYSNVPDSPVNFESKTFSANQLLETQYQFNSYRLGYTYLWYKSDKMISRIGFTAKIRDAFIKLTQNGDTEIKTNLGFVPLLYVSFCYNFLDDWSLNADMDALGGGPGYAIDIKTELQYLLTSSLGLGLGFRSLSGGAKVTSTTNFADFNFYFLSLNYYL